MQLFKENSVPTEAGREKNLFLLQRKGEGQIYLFQKYARHKARKPEIREFLPQLDNRTAVATGKRLLGKK
ncbi:hypothetical protein E2320_005460, partial [Naja naja]